MRQLYGAFTVILDLTRSLEDFRGNIPFQPCCARHNKETPPLA